MLLQGMINSFQTRTIIYKFTKYIIQALSATHLGHHQGYESQAVKIQIGEMRLRNIIFRGKF